MPVFTVDGTHVPEQAKPHEHWVLWGLDEEGRKRPLAPWIRGDLYPVRWGSKADERPETDWQTAYTHWKRRDSYSAPTGMDTESVMPAPLLLHDPLNPPLMLVDFDDVRDPQTGQVTAEVADIVERLDAYCEVSQSGEGLHLFVRAELPGRLGKFIAPLAGEGDIELYDHGRAVGATWDHVAGTPTKVPERQDVVDEIVQSYEDSSQRKRRLNTTEQTGEGRTSADIQLKNGSTPDTDSNISPYFEIDIRGVADTGYFSSYRGESPGGDWEGPHPGHGPQHSDPDKCTNFGAVPLDDVWYCFAHDSGGRTIELAAVLCPHTDIRCNDVPGQNGQIGGWLTGQPFELLTTCVWLREEGAIGADAKPPHAALLATAELADMHIRDKENGVLGETNAEIAREVYDKLTIDDVS